MQEILTQLASGIRPTGKVRADMIAFLVLPLLLHGSTCRANRCPLHTSYTSREARLRPHLWSRGRHGWCCLWLRCWIRADVHYQAFWSVSKYGFAFSVVRFSATWVSGPSWPDLLSRRPQPKETVSLAGVAVSYPLTVHPIGPRECVACRLQDRCGPLSIRCASFEVGRGLTFDPSCG